MIARRSAVGWSAVVLIFVLGIVWDAPELQAQTGPTFAPFDAGGMPSNLIELAPRAFSKGEILPTGSYVIWAAIKKPGTPYLTAAWKRYGPYTPTGGQRYVANYDGVIRGISLGNFTNAQYASLKPTEVQINIDNWHSEAVFFVINTAAGGLAGSPAVLPAGGGQIPANLACDWLSFSLNGVIQSGGSEEQQKDIQFSFRDADGTQRVPLAGMAFTREFRRTEEGRTVLYRISGELAPDLSSITRLSVSFDHEPSVFARGTAGMDTAPDVYKNPRSEGQQRWSVTMAGIPIREGYPKDGAWDFLAQFTAEKAAPKGFSVTAASYLSSTDTSWTQNDAEGRPKQMRDATRLTGFDTKRLKSVRVEIRFAPPKTK